MTNETVLYDRLRKNPWNPNVMTGRVYEAELESIKEFGFIDPITVREAEDGALEIIDGEHRWKGYGELRARWQRGELDDAHFALVSLFENGEVPVSNLGVVPDPDAKKLTLILNETRGRANTVDVAALLAEIAAETGGEGLGRGLPYNEPELAEILKLAEYDWNAVANTPQSGGLSDAASGEGESGFIALSLLISEAGNGVLEDAFGKVKAEFAAEERVLHENPKMALGQVIEHLAVQFLNSLA